MSKKDLSDRLIFQLPIRKKLYEVVDVDNPGLGIRVNPGGKKSWFVRSRKNSRIRVIGLGSFGDINYQLAVAYYQDIKRDNSRGVLNEHSVTREANYLLLVLKNHYYKHGKFPNFLQQGSRISALADVYRVSFESIVMLLEHGCFTPLLKRKRLKLIPSEEILLSSSFHNYDRE